MMTESGIIITTQQTNVTNLAPPPSKLWLSLGVTLSIIGNFLISVGMNIQKYSHNQLIYSGKSYVKSFKWWCGFTLMVIGELGNFAAYGFAPTSLVAPLGSTSVITNALIAFIFLKEKIRGGSILGIIWAIIGAYILFTFSVEHGEIISGAIIITKLRRWPFIIYVVIEISAFLVLVGLRYRHNYINVVTILLQGAILGSFTVMSAKAVSSMLTYSALRTNQFKEPILYIMLVIMVISGVLQVKYLNNALADYDVSVVMPINFILFTISAMLSGVIFYEEFYRLATLQILMILLAAVLSFVGVFLLTNYEIFAVSNDKGESGNGSVKDETVSEDENTELLTDTTLQCSKDESDCEIDK